MGLGRKRSFLPKKVNKLIAREGWQEQKRRQRGNHPGFPMGRTIRRRRRGRLVLAKRNPHVPAIRSAKAQNIAVEI